MAGLRLPEPATTRRGRRDFPGVGRLQLPNYWQQVSLSEIAALTVNGFFLSAAIFPLGLLGDRTRRVGENSA